MKVYIIYQTVNIMEGKCLKCVKVTFWESLLGPTEKYGSRRFGYVLWEIGELGWRKMGAHSE